MMLIRMIVKDDARGYDETYASPTNVSNMSTAEQEEEAWRIAAEVIQNFNDTLRPYELPRTLQSATILDLTTQPECHRWEKTSVVVQQDEIGMHETYLCNLCSNTGKQYQMNGPIIIDGSSEEYDDDEDEEITESQLADRETIRRLRADNKRLTNFVDKINAGDYD